MTEIKSEPAVRSQRSTPQESAESASNSSDPLPANSAASAASFGTRWREFFQLQNATRQASRRSFKASDPGWPEFLVARSTLADAHQLEGAGDGAPSALLLYRSAAKLLFRAQSLRGGLATAAQSHDAAAQSHDISALSAQSAADKALFARLTVEQLAATNGLLDSAHPEECIAGLSPAQRQCAMDGLRTLGLSMADDLMQQTLPLRRVARAKLRRRAAALLGIVAMTGVIWHKVTARENLAIRKPVTLSSSESYGPPAAQLVDGNRSNLGFHTRDGANQFATLDLGKVTRIERVHVYNRIDCCQERALPLSIEVSRDGKEFVRVALRNEPFLFWEAEFQRVEARFVRVRHEPVGFLHLSEVEIY